MAALIPDILVAQTQKVKKPMNILFIGSDDMRPQLNCYGFTQMITPNIDRWASEGVLFNYAYVQQAVCAASAFSGLDRVCF